MLKSLICAAAMAAVTLPTMAAAETSALERFDNIFIPMQGAWGDGQGNSFLFQNGDSTNNGWVNGNLIGSGGVSNRYVWQATGPSTGVLYVDTNQGRQGPIYVTFNSGTQMTWQFGGQSAVLHKA